jgi:peptidylprolyl isomerase
VRRLLALLAVPLLLLAGCGGGSEPEPDAAGASAGALDAVSVSGEPGEKPTVEVDTPLEAGEGEHQVLTEGDGDRVGKGQRVSAELVSVNGDSGEEIESSYETDGSVGFPMDPEQINTALYDALLDVPVGSRVLALLPPTAEGSPATVVVLDVLDARTLPTRAEGTPVTPPAGLPTVTLADDGAPTVKIPATEPPTELIIQPLIKGGGPAVEQGRTITVQYTGVKWDGGQVFDSSWKNGSPASFPIGTGNVIPGWDAGLVGQTAGSQVLLVIPPDKGYGAAGAPDAGISGTDTLVFVVDILDAG